MTPEALERAILAFDTNAVIQLVIGATERERRKAAPKALEIARKSINLNSFMHVNEHASWMDFFNWKQRVYPAADLATLGTCTLPELRRLEAKSRVRPKSAGLLRFDLLNRIRPAWLSEWVDWRLEAMQSPGTWGFEVWELIRRLILAGAVERPHSDAYVRAMLFGIAASAVSALTDARFHWAQRTDVKSLVREKMVSLLRADRDLIETDLWMLFEASELPQLHDDNWQWVIVDLAAAGDLDRMRVLQSCVSAIGRDAPLLCKFCTDLYERLEPSLETRTEHTDAFLAALDSRSPDAVKLAIKSLGLLEKASRIEPVRIVHAIAPVLTNPSKAIATSALKLLGRAANRDRSTACAACLAATGALANSNVDIQRQAAELLQSLDASSDAACCEAIARNLDSVADSVRQILVKLVPAARWAAAGAEGAVFEARVEELICRARSLTPTIAEQCGVPRALRALEGETLALTGLKFDPLQMHRLVGKERIAPVTDLDELIDLVAAVIEQDGPPDAMERALDGISRLCGHRPPDFARRTSALLKRALEIHERQGTLDIGEMSQELCRLTITWIRRNGFYRTDRSSAYYQWPPLRTFVSERVLEISRRVTEGRARPMLAAPTHAGGWIDPIVAVSRFLEYDDTLPKTVRKFGLFSVENHACSQFDVCDIIQALLRLAPDGRAEALHLAVGKRGEAFEALRYALGAEDVKVGVTPQVWAAAARARAPHRDDPQISNRFRCLPEAASRAPKLSIDWKMKPKGMPYRQGHVVCDPDIPKSLDFRLPTVAHFNLIQRYAAWEWRGASHVAWMLSIWPQYRESWWVTTAYTMERVRSSEADIPVLELLADSAEPMTPAAADLLVLGLGADKPLVRAGALDALVASVGDTRLTGAELGDALCRAIVIEGIVPQRWAPVLLEAARVSHLHSVTIRAALEKLFAAQPEHPAAKLLALLEAQVELAAQTGIGVGDPKARVWLESITGTSKTAKAAKALLAGPANGNQTGLRDAAAQVLKARVERAETMAAQSSLF
jgi:hypothetical protein